MADPLFATAVTCSAMCCLGIWLVAVALWPAEVRLADAFAMLDDQAPRRETELGPQLVTDRDSRLEHTGAWLYQHARLPITDTTARLLMLQGRSIGDYLIHKLLLAAVGLFAPILLALGLAGLLPGGGGAPVLLGLVLGAVGWWWPDLAMRRQQRQTSADAEEALNTFFDLVVLERLANLSATQALEAAAHISDVPVFVSIRAGLERARLEQRPPWTDLHRLAHELELPQIGDIADVMRLDEQGAALAEILADRVKELRDAHLTRERTAAHQVSERMTVWMSIPVVIFALSFLIPPLLNIAGIG